MASGATRSASVLGLLDIGAALVQLTLVAVVLFVVAWRPPAADDMIEQTSERAGKQAGRVLRGFEPCVRSLLGF